jgi:hypothetical protein
MSRPARRRGAMRLAGIVAIAVLVMACSPPAGNVATPGSGGDPAAATKALIVGALGAVGLQAVDAIKPYRPPETPSLTGAPRSIIQVQLPDDPDHGFIVIYALGSATAAEKAAFDQAAYVASGTGGIQFPPGSHFVIRTVDTTMIFFTWSPGSSPDQRTHLIEDALHTVGIAVPVGG